MNQNLKEKFSESLAAVLPITIIVFLISVLLVPVENGPIMLFLVGAMMLVVGMGLFQLGAEIAMGPLGSGIGVTMSKSNRIWQVALAALVIGIGITIAEPDLQVLAEQVPSIPTNLLVLIVALGVGLFLVMAILRIMWRISLSKMLMFFYALMLIGSFFVPKDFIAVAFDAGGVTTGPITVPFIMAVGTGLASIRRDKGAVDDSFGLVALCSIGPIIAVLILGCVFKPEEAAYSLSEVYDVSTTRDVVMAFVRALPKYAKEVLVTIIPIIVLFFVFQLMRHRFNRAHTLQIAVGIVYTYARLVLFMCGVNVGFGPLGTELGRALGNLHYRWVLIPIGMLIGFYIVKAEPAIQVLNRQIHEITDGAISEKAMNICMSVGVCASVGLSMLRILTGIPIRYILVPGYIIALVLSFKVPKIFVGIAFDSGGVASGPMTTTFLLPLSLGACEVMGGNVMTDAFGVVAMVALTPLIAVQIMGVLYQNSLNANKQNDIIPDDSDDIIVLEED